MHRIGSLTGLIVAGQVGLEPIAEFLAECFILGAEIEIHLGLQRREQLRLAAKSRVGRPLPYACYIEQAARSRQGRPERRCRALGVVVPAACGDRRRAGKLGSFAHFRIPNFNPLSRKSLENAGESDLKLGSFGIFYSFSPLQTARLFHRGDIS
ncbi:MAG: hypothetical protein ACREQI_01025 [Candidatus Binataceae bacterium]